MTQQTQSVLNLFPSPMREVLLCLSEHNKAVVVGYDIHVNLSEIPTLPPNLESRHYEFLKKRGGRTQSVTNTGKKETYEHPAMRLLCFSEYKCKGNLQGYTIHIKGKKIDPHQNPITDDVFGKMKVEKPDFIAWVFDAITLDKGIERVEEVSPQKDAALYVFFLLSHVDTANPILGSINKAIMGERTLGIATYRDITKVNFDRNAGIIDAAKAIVWVDTLKLKQIQFLQSKIVADLGEHARALSKLQHKEAICSELCSLAQRGFALNILKYQEEIGDIEIPALALAKEILVDALDMKVLALDEDKKKNGLIICQEYEQEFDGLCERIEIGIGVGKYSRLQFFTYQSNIAMKVAEYIANNPNAADVMKLQEIVFRLLPSYPVEEIAKGGVVEFNSIRTSNGTFRKK